MLLAVPSRGPMSGPPQRLAELGSAPWALDPPGTASGDWARAVCRAAGFEPQVRYEGPDPLLHAHLVRTGHAVAFIPGLIAADHLHGTQLARLPGDPHRTLYTAVRAGRAGHPAVRALRDAMAQVVADRPAQSPAGTLRE
ncbi:LysR substrate-binding domain-containing protein [Gordonia sp. CPCC 205515]|uniref:LysR substrate-binding domain-containing protein n=1 Tax=Gordonia sp. CPCC 205515 TaxID=3140791 RepID=UPI003AF333F1